MEDIPNINPAKPLWPTRPDDRNPNRKPPQNKKKKKEKPETGEGQQDNQDGHIDEYV
jgi:hypothetical protein